MPQQPKACHVSGGVQRVAEPQHGLAGYAVERRHDLYRASDRLVRGEAALDGRGQDADPERLGQDQRITRQSPHIAQHA